MTASVASMVRPKVPRSLTKPMSELERAAKGIIGVFVRTWFDEDLHVGGSGSGGGVGDG